MRIGVLGIGHLAAYLIRGAQGAGFSFVLSPRNAAKAADLADRFGCEVAASNQDVVDSCQHLLVCLPAASGLAVLRDLRFRAGQSVLSAMAGAGLDDLRAAVAPAQGLVSMMPGYANAYAAGPSLLYPADPDWHAFLSALGPVHPFDAAEPFETAAVFGAMSGATVFLIRHLADWYVRHGLPPDTARRLVAETLRGNAEVYLQSPEAMAEITAGVTTPGGITEQLVAHLHATGALRAWDDAMDAVLVRMSPGRKPAE